MVLRNKSLTAFIAHEIPLAGVDFHMLFEILQLEKRLIANITCVELLKGVRVFMLSKVVLSAVRFLTESTLKASTMGMCVHVAL